MIDFVSENEFCTPLDYANATGSLLCAEILLLFGAMTAEALLSKVSTEIGRIWRGYKARKLTNFTPKSRALVEKDERSLPMFYISNSTSDMKPLSRSSTNGHEEQSTRHPNPSLQTLGVPGDLTAALMANRQRRGSSVSMTHFVGRTSTLTGQYYRHEQPIHSIPALPAPDVKDEAATKIQRAWRFRQRRIEAKFLVFMMGPEEASKILEKNFARQQSMISANGSRSSSIGTPQGSGGSASGSSVLLSRDCVLPPTRNHQVRRGSVQTNIGRSNLRLNVQSRPYQLASSRRGSVTTDSTMGGIFNVHGVGSGPSGMQHGFFAQGLASPPTEIEFMSLKTQPHHASSGAKPYQSPKQEENLEFRSNQESSAMTKRRISRKKTYEGSIETLERESSTYLAKKLTKKKTISSSTKTTVSSTRMGESLTADEIDYFRDVAQEYRSGGLKELLNRSKTTSLKPKVVQAAIREEREQPIEPSKSVISQTDARLGNTFSEDELSYFAMMAEEKQREG